MRETVALLKSRIEQLSKELTDAQITINNLYKEYTDSSNKRDEYIKQLQFSCNRANARIDALLASAVYMYDANRRISQTLYKQGARDVVMEYDRDVPTMRDLKFKFDPEKGWGKV